MGLGTTEIILIVLAVLILFGAKKIPEFARGLGKGMNEFKKAKDEVNDAINTEEKEDNNKTDWTHKPKNEIFYNCYQQLVIK